MLLVERSSNTEQQVLDVLAVLPPGRHRRPLSGTCAFEELDQIIDVCRITPSGRYRSARRFLCTTGGEERAPRRDASPLDTGPTAPRGRKMGIRLPAGSPGVGRIGMSRR
jgi:hypothetical protein